MHNTDGYLVCLELQTGAKVWSRHAKSEFKSSATWHGCLASPLVTDAALILPVTPIQFSFSASRGFALLSLGKRRDLALPPGLTA